MHSYLRPIGFSRYINKVRVNKLIDKVMEKLAKEDLSVEELIKKGLSLLAR